MLFKNKKLFIAILIILAALGAVSVLQGCKNAMEYSQDFQWDAAKALSLGFDPYDESMDPSPEFLSLGYEKYYMQMEANQFPSLLMLLYPYTLLGPLGARYAWLLSNLVFTLLILVLLRLTFFREADRESYILLCLLMIAGTPWRNQIGVGQHSLFSLMFFLLSVWFMNRQEEKGGILLTILAAAALGISFFKYTLTAPLALYYVYRRRFDIPVLSVIPHVAMTFWAASWLDTGVADMIKKPLKVASWLSGEGSMDIGALISAVFPGAASFAMIITALIMAALFFLMLYMKPGQDRLVFSLLTLWSLIMTYHRIYDFFVMIIPFCLFLCGARSFEKGSRTYFFVYTVLTVYIFFVLRIFKEARWPVAIGGFVYYILTFVLLWRAVSQRPAPDEKHGKQR